MLLGRYFITAMVLIGLPALVLGQSAAAGPQKPNGFNALDTNHDGKISRQEAITGQTKRFHAMDTNGNGKISRSEFRHAMTQRYGSLAKMGPRRRRLINKRINTWFNRLDKNGNGQISLSEYQNAMSAYFDHLDHNNDGELEPDELKQALGSKQKKQYGIDRSAQSHTPPIHQPSN